MLRVCGVNPVIRILYLSGILDHPGIQYEPFFLDIFQIILDMVALDSHFTSYGC